MFIKRKSIFQDIYYQPYNNKFFRYNRNIKDDECYVQRLGLLKKLPVHQGCVNTICWNESGEYILSGSDDQHLAITNGHDFKVKGRFVTNHRTNIFSAKFLPLTNDSQIVSCSGDGVIIHTDINSTPETEIHKFRCHNGTTYEIVTIPMVSDIFFSCGEDGTVRCFDLRMQNSCTQTRCQHNVIISTKRAVTALAINPINSNHIAVGCVDAVRLFDRRFLRTISEGSSVEPFCTFKAPMLEEPPYRITCLNYFENGKEILVSYSSDHLYLFDLKSMSRRSYQKSSVHNAEKVENSSGSNRKSSTSRSRVRRLRLRGDWSDTGPNARPEREGGNSVGQARPQLQDALMRRMTEVLSRMLNDPVTRATLSGIGEEALDPESVQRLTDHAPEPLNSQEGEDARSPDNPSTTDESENNRLPIATNSSDPENQPSTSDSSAATRDLRNNLNVLRNLRQDFIEHHGSEPSVSLKYSSQSTSQSTISLNCNSGNHDDNERVQTNVATNLMSEDSSSDDEISGGNIDGDMDDCNVYQASLRMQFQGHRNARTMIKEATFWGKNYVMSGSDCGHIFIWNKDTGKLRMVLQGDHHVVNCLQPHPTLPILATSGIDYDVKLWAPVLEEPGYDYDLAAELTARNAVMLQETRDTITVPAAFMIRMLAFLNQVPRNRARRRREVNESSQ